MDLFSSNRPLFAAHVWFLSYGAKACWQVEQTGWNSNYIDKIFMQVWTLQNFLCSFSSMFSNIQICKFVLTEGQKVLLCQFKINISTCCSAPTNWIIVKQRRMKNQEILYSKSNKKFCVCIYIYAYTCTHTHTHTYIYTYILHIQFIYTHTYTHIYIPICTYTYIHTHTVHTYIHIYIHT